MAAPGIKVVTHNKPSTRQSWETNGEIGHYVGPAMEHYRCFRIYFPKIRAIRIVDTVKFIPHLILVPELKLDDFLRKAADDIVTLLAKPPATTISYLQAEEETNLALTSLAKILQSVEPFPVQPTDVHPVKHKARKTRVLP